RFAGHGLPVTKSSAMAMGPGPRFHIDSIKRISSDEAEVSGGYWAGPTHGSQNVYTVVRKNGKWVVERDMVVHIS
ncbi:unnamed protein product, partial [marine sediment metagenome]